MSTKNFGIVPQSDFEAKLLNLIYQYLRHPEFGTSFLANKLGMSRRNLQRQSKSKLGISPKAYIRNIQLAMAAYYAKNSSFSTITEIANQVGLTNPTYLSSLYFQKNKAKLRITTPKE